MDKKEILDLILYKEKYNDIKFTKVNFPDKPRTNIKLWLYKYGFKYCATCKEVKLLEEFSNNKTRNIGKNSWCKGCFKNYQENNLEIWKVYASLRRAKVKEALPKGEQLKNLYSFYKNCPQGYEVDHILPLNNKKVCGLHCLDNLQYLKISENRSKSNSF